MTPGLPASARGPSVKPGSVAGLTFEEFRTDFLQAVVWFEGYEPSGRDIMRLAATKWFSRFDGEPTLLPVAAGLPPELPRAIVVSADGHWRVQLAANRFELTWDQQLDQTVNGPDNFSTIVSQTLAPFVELDDKLRLTRIAYLIRRYLPTSDPGKRLASYFVRSALRSPDGPLNRPEGFEIHAHKQYQPPKLPQINSWVRWRTAVLAKDNSPVISVSQDLNTLATRDTAYSLTEAETFFANSPLEADGILRLYLSSPTTE